MEDTIILKLGTKVVPNKKNYARPLEQSEEWQKALKNNQNFLYVTFIHNSNKYGNIFVLSEKIETGQMGDFFLLDDFEILEENEAK